VTRRIVAVASGGGGILDAALRHDELVRAQVVSVVVDRECGAIGVAAAHQVPCRRVDERDNSRFSDTLLAHCRDVGADHVVLFFNRLLAGDVLSTYEQRIVNLHASLLPAFPGLHALEQARRAGARFVGTTVHLIDDRVDAGQVILQSVLPVDPGGDVGIQRHRQFVQFCKGLMQTCHWLEEDRIRVVDGRAHVAGARFDQLDFSPSLEAGTALGFAVPYPPAT
jgi:phosphoribosylglycinamide formyltransferase-1